ncbi:hypothetical protein [Micromonospora sp. WMMD708]|uniref:hypothetical protein n=1 Tax=Micromonospora sp. WMMD708 TaxID=3403464 RepID=UPI003BF61AFE
MEDRDERGDGVAGYRVPVPDRAPRRPGPPPHRPRPAGPVSPGGTDASLLELAVGFVVAVSLIAVITVVLGRRADRRDLVGTQVRELEARVAAATSPDADTRAWDAATRIAAARSHEAASPDSVDPPSAGTPAADATSPGAETPGGATGERPVQDPTAPPAGSTAGGNSDAMVDAFAWLRIAALVEAGQREQAVDLLSATMAISVDEAELLVEGLDGAGDRHTGGARWRD